MFELMDEGMEEDYMGEFGRPARPTPTGDTFGLLSKEDWEKLRCDLDIASRRKKRRKKEKTTLKDPGPLLKGVKWNNDMC